METTINEAIETIADIDKAYRTFTDKEYRALNIVVDTVKKYQKIQEIYEKWFCDYTSAEVYTKLSEVLKDGNDTTNTRNN